MSKESLEEARRCCGDLPWEKKLHWTTTFGEIGVEEQLFLQNGSLIRPFSDPAGVKCRGYSLLLQRRLTDFGSEKSFGRAAEQVKEHYGIDVPISRIRLITEEHGERLLGESELLQGSTKGKGNTQLIAESDGCMVPIVDFDLGGEGDLRKKRQVGWKEARLSLVYKQGSVEPVFGATMGSPEQAGAQLNNCAKGVGIDEHTQIHAVGDGATWISDQMDVVFGAQCSYLIDFYHLCDYLAAASKSYGAYAATWFKTQKRQMKTGKTDEVLQELKPHLEPLSIEDKDAPVRKCHRYIQNRLNQFDYPRALEADLPIGSGEIESANKYIIQERMKISGAWWKIDNCEKMLTFRILRRNGNWNNYWNSRKAA